MDGGMLGMEVVRQIMTIFMLIVSVVLNVVILMQQSKETGLGSVFGGESSSLSLKGKSATKEAKLRKITVILAVVLGLFALIMVALPA